MFPDEIDVFLSHADAERFIAGKIKEGLASYSINVFVAHDDIEGGDEWMSMLTDAIHECDIFLILLSEKFHKANFTDHEVGIAYCLKRPMIPVAIDKTVPYGFMSKYQAFKAREGLSEYTIRQLADKIYLKVAGPNIVDYVIDMFARVGSFDKANKMIYLLDDYSDSFSPENVHTLVTAFLANRQIRAAFTAGDKIRGYLKQYSRHLTLEEKSNLSEFIDFHS